MARGLLQSDALYKSRLLESDVSVTGYITSAQKGFVGERLLQSNAKYI